MSAGLTALTTAHGVVDGVHDDAAVAGTATEPAAAAGLTADFEVVFGVGDDAYGGAAGLEDHAHFAAGHFDDGVLVVAGHELGVGAGGADHFSALAGTEFDVVDECAEGDFGECEGVADFWGDAFAGHDCLADLEALRGEDVAFFAVGVADEGDAGAAVGVVLDGFDDSGDAVFVAFEVDEAVHSFVAAADVAHGHLTLVVAAAGFAEAVDQAFFRSGSGDVVIGDDDFVALARGCRFDSF